MDSIGWIGSTMLAICALPQAIQSYRQKHSRGLGWLFISLWGIGEILTLAYVFPKADWPLIFNYSLNLGFLAVIVFYKLKD